MECSFEVNPLDINLARIQFNMQNTISSTKGNENIREVYESKDPTLNISFVECVYLINGDNCQIILIVTDKSGLNKSEHNIILSSKQNVVDFIYSREFLFTCKKIILEIVDKSF